MKKEKLRGIMRIILPLIAVLILAGCLSFDSGTTFTIRNDTGYLILGIYVSPTTNSTWGPDRLGSNDFLRSGGSQRFILPPDASTSYDIMLVDSDGDRYIKLNVQISGNMTITFTFDDIDVDYLLQRTGQ